MGKVLTFHVTSEVELAAPQVARLKASHLQARGVVENKGKVISGKGKPAKLWDTFSGGLVDFSPSSVQYVVWVSLVLVVSSVKPPFKHFAMIALALP